MKPYKSIKSIPYEHFIPSACGPGALKIALSHFKKNYSEAELAKICMTTAANGTEYYDMIAAVKKLGGRVVVPKKRGTLEEIEYYIKKCRVPVVVAWFYCLDFSFIPGGHYSVIVNIDSKNVLLMDPIHGKDLKKLPRLVFEALWFGFIGKTEENVLWNWYMVPTFSPLKLHSKSRYA